MFLLMEKGLEDDVDDVEDNANDNAADAKTHGRGEGPDATVVKGQTGEKPQSSQVDNFIMMSIADRCSG